MSVYGDTDAAVIAWMLSGWNKFKQLSSFLTAKGPHLSLNGMVRSNCVRSFVLRHTQQWNLARLSVLTAIFQVNLVFSEAKDDGDGGDNWNTGVISRAKLQSNHQHQQTNIQ